MLKYVRGATILLFAVLVSITPVMAQSRIALVIGNSSYKSAPLANPVNDAALMAKTLEETGFRVTKIIDADQKTMKRALIEFGRQLRSSDAVGLFYYAGHGVQVNGENYLIPIGINIQDETEVNIEAINVNSFIGTMERSSKAINIVILDACRNNPFARSFRSATRGLARVSAPRGSYVAYATAPGQVAYDGDPGNSPYTLALTKAISTPGLTIEKVFKQTRREVLKATKDRQTPWENSSIIGDFYFKKPLLTAQIHNQTLPPPLVIDDTSIELAYWEPDKDSHNRSLFKSYLGEYPKVKFSILEVERFKNPAFKKHATPVTVPTPMNKNKEALTRMLQKELTRVGCSPGKIDGKWGPSGISALKKYNHFAKHSVKANAVSHSAYQMIKNSSSRVCPQNCTEQSELKNGRCVSRTANLNANPLVERSLKPKCGIFNGTRFCE